MLLWETDWRDPFDAFAPLAGEPYAHLLHGGDLSTRADWSVIAAFPTKVIAGGGAANPFLEIDRLLNERRYARKAAQQSLPFTSGLLGFIGYEAARHLEPSLELPSSPFAAPEMLLGVYDAAALFSRGVRRAYIAGRNEKACRRLEEALGGPGGAGSREQAAFRSAVSNFTAQRYRAAVSEVIENILDGDYYQANISHRIEAQAGGPVNAFALFRRLAARSDAMFGACLQYPGGAVVSNSPERFFRINRYKDGKRKIVAEPIKGTRRREKAPDQDQLLARELLQDRKDRAENIMIADLLRNDLSRVCRDRTVREESICELMSLVNVHHLVSRISGELRDDARMPEIFAALFPCGSVTGAPKIEAMNAIARIEKTGRGPYCGAIGYIDDSGSADFSVAIRTLVVEGDRVSIPVGGGVTLRSDPQKEYEETIVKAAGALAALDLEPGGLL